MIRTVLSWIVMGLYGVTLSVLLPTSVLFWLSAGNSTLNPHPGEWWLVNIPLWRLLEACEGFWIFSISGVSAVVFLVLVRRYLLAGITVGATVLLALLQTADRWDVVSIVWVLVSAVFVYAAAKWIGARAAFTRQRGRVRAMARPGPVATEPRPVPMPREPSWKSIRLP